MNAESPAFPFDPVGLAAKGGLTKREYSAIQIAASFSANPEFNNVIYKDIAKWSVDQADALIAELSKSK